MEEKNPQILKKILLGLLVFLGVVLFAVVYTVIDSRIHRQKDPTSPEAYGVDSLDAVVKPPFEIEIWQKNEKLSEEPDPYTRMIVYEPQAKYYTRVPLKLEPGQSVTTTFDPMTMPTPREYALIATVYCDEGVVRCTYDLPVQDLVTMKASSDLVPAVYGGDIRADNSDVIQSTDGVITGSGSFSFSISDRIRNHLVSLYDKAYANPVSKMMLNQIETNSGIKLSDYYKLEKLKDVYPDAPYELQDYERLVLTTRLTVEALHPTKPDVSVASAVLEIKSCTWWLNSDIVPFSVFEEAGIPNYEYSVVTVVSYEQSDMLLMDLYS